VQIRGILMVIYWRSYHFGYIRLITMINVYRWIIFCGVFEFAQSSVHEHSENVWFHSDWFTEHFLIFCNFIFIHYWILFNWQYTILHSLYPVIVFIRMDTHILPSSCLASCSTSPEGGHANRGPWWMWAAGSPQVCLCLPWTSVNIHMLHYVQCVQIMESRFFVFEYNLLYNKP